MPSPYAGPVQRKGADDRLGMQVLGKYVIESRLGERPSVCVYLARDPGQGQPVAIKVYDGPGYEGAQVRQRFAHDAEAARRLATQHVVHVHDHGETPDGALCVVMEYLPGRTLTQLFHTDAPLVPARAVAIAAQICEALAEAHAAGIVHRQLSPPNVMVIAREQNPDFVQILDLGVLEPAGPPTAPEYAAPEQFGTGPADARADVYALGVLLFEALTGQLPFRGADAAEVGHKHQHEPPPPMASVGRHAAVPPALEAAVLHAMAKDPADRPASARAFAQSLRDALAGQAPAGYVVAAPPPSQAAPAVADGGGGSKLGLAVFGLALVGVVAAVSYFLLS